MAGETHYGENACPVRGLGRGKARAILGSAVFESIDGTTLFGVSEGEEEASDESLLESAVWAMGV